MLRCAILIITVMGICALQKFSLAIYSLIIKMLDMDDTNKAQDLNEALEPQQAEESDDVVYDDAENAGDVIKKLKERLKKTEAEKQEYLNGWQRMKADYVNANKRNEEERKDFIKYATEALVEDLVPTLQNFDSAFSNKEVWEKVDKNWRVGVEYIYQNLRQTLESRGLKEINPLNLPFDPARDEAVEHVEVTTEAEDGKIVEVLQKGYELNGKNLKAPRVKVGDFKKA